MQKKIGFDINHTIFSKLVKTRTNSKYLIWYLDKVIRPLVLILLKMSGCVETLEVKMKTDKKSVNWCLSVFSIIS